MSPAMRITTVGLDADDTLWHNETIFRLTQERLKAMMAEVAPPQALEAKLAEIEKKNLRLYGYGVKGFTLSMIETALTLSGHQVDATRIERILSLGKELLAHPVELLDGVAETLDVLRRDRRLVLITMGDLFPQESKVAAAGVSVLFEGLEIVAEKDVATYGRIMDRMGTRPSGFCMVGNSVRSDIAPVLELGGAGVHVPYHITWAHERAEVPATEKRFRRIANLAELPPVLSAL
jgi:putative hydrolase of the HAD superfamily